MHITTETMAVLWLGAGAVALWMWLPAVLNALGLTLWQVSMDDDAAALEPSGSDAAYEELFAQLRCLGFVPVGRRSKACWFSSTIGIATSRPASSLCRRATVSP